VGEERQEGEEGGMGRVVEEFYDFVRDTLWAGCLAGAERVNRFIKRISCNHVARVRVEYPQGSMKNGSGLSGFSQGGDGYSGRVARVSYASKCEWTASMIAVGKVAVVIIGSSCAVVGEKAALNFQ
jgi:hypothetical protein